MSDTYERLFSPFSFAGLTAKNRIVMAPMGTGLPEHDGTSNARTLAYYRLRAEGGVGMMTLEASLVSPDAYGVGPELRLHGEQFLPGLTELASAIKEYDIPVGIQLWHPGRQTLLGQPIGPSAVPLSSRTPMPHAMTIDEIHEMVDWYALSAAIAKEAGFDYVEVHGAHCYLPCEFISPLSNLRDDEYGGSLENRARFPIEVVRAIKERCGADYPVSYRISGEEGAEGGFTLEDSTQVCKWLEEAGVDTISVSAGNWYALHYTIGPMFMPRGYLLHLARAIRAAVSVPVTAAGRLDDPALAEQALADGDADLIAVGRGLIADPDWPVKIRTGHRSDVRPCISCNACVDLVAQAQEARCAVNPEVGRELGWEIGEAAVAKRVMVVGGGPAGMEAARIARLRGHDVSIWDREPELGGKLDVASRAPSKHTVLDFRDYQARKLAELGVHIHTSSVVTSELVAAENPDVVVVSVGADPLIPPIPGADGPNVLDAQEILHGRVAVAPGEKVVIVGGSATGCETAEWLLGAGAEVTIVEMLPTVGQGIELITRKHLLAELKEQGLTIITRAKVTMIDANEVIYESVETGAQAAIPADRVAMAVGWRPQGEKFAADLGSRTVILAGDAARPADFVAAIQAGANAGLAI